MSPAVNGDQTAGQLAKVIPLRQVSPIMTAAQETVREPGAGLAPVRTIHPALLSPPPSGVRQQLGRQLNRVASFAADRLAGRYTVDEYGHDPHALKSVLFPALRPLADHWLDVTVSGLEYLPDAGGALIVANHAGVFPLDGLIAQLTVHDFHAARRIPRVLAAGLLLNAPLLGAAARKAGHVAADEPTAQRLLRAGELTLAFPEGFRGAGKPYRQRYQVQRFGNYGYVGAAIRAGAPIVPCTITGSAESYPKLGDIGPLAKIIGLPYFPVTPLFPHFGLLGLIPLPAQWHIEFGEPIETAHFPRGAADEPAALAALADRVRDRIQAGLPGR